ncbi:MAG: hypothetical protein F4206_00730 [Gammaproteobacteria bacterium]|nr:hypothetical protein [Gammaproteobacteria bacterium]MYG65238.1 hypothetical protein [Gammaproteobacteria bacterium]
MNRAVSIAPLFTLEQCQEIVKLRHAVQPEPGLVRGVELDPKTRISTIRWLRRAKAPGWIFDAVDDQVQAMNAHWHRLDIHLGRGGYPNWDYEAQSCPRPDFQLTEYREPDGWYRAHQDSDLMNDRKLSFTVLLNDDFGGGELTVKGADMNMIPGEICCFPAIVMHGVRPVTAGTRYSLVGWYTGPPWK